MDVMMPEMDGSVMKNIRKIPELSSVLITFLTLKRRLFASCWL
jgi:CheY-like chemotaxis protein